MMNNSRYIDSIQTLRGISFLGIFLCHAGSEIHWGGIGVAVFFIISGFVMTLTYWDKPIENSIRNCIKFSVNKISKLYGLHFITTIAMALLLMIGQVLHGKFDIELPCKTMINLALLQAWIPSTRWSNSLNGVAWYLSVTLFLYFLFPSILFHIKKIIPKMLK